jgi:sigma-B regulation protein RsbU (phosphoserine phosphatase)
MAPDQGASTSLADLLSPAARARAAVRQVQAGAPIVVEDEPGASAFILLSGACDVIVHGDRVNVVRPGEFFGDMACLEGGTRSATVRAARDSVVMEIDAETLLSELTRSPALLDEFLRALTRRARGMSRAEAEARREHRELRHVVEGLQPPLDRFRSHPRISVDVSWEPLFLVSGDYYDVRELSSSRLLFAVGDVMGHGAPTAPILGMILGQLRESSSLHERPAGLLAHLHAHMRRHGHANVFSTLSLLLLDLEASTAEFAVAGPPAPLVYAAGRCAPLTTSIGWTLGYPVDDVTFASERMPVAPGTRFLLYTDGLCDAACGPNPERDVFGIDRLSATFRELCEGGSEEIGAALHARVRQYRGRWPPEDDATALVVGIR